MSDRTMRRGAMALAALVVLGLGTLIYDGAQDDHIAEGIEVGPVDVGGMDVGEAREAVRRRVGRTLPRRIVVTHRSTRFVLSAETARLRLDAAASAEAASRRGREGNPVGRTLDRLLGAEVQATVTPRIRYDRAVVDRWLTRVARRIDRPARNADIDFHDGKLQRRRARNGLRLRRSELERKVLGQLEGRSAARTLRAPVTIVKRPDRTLEDLAARYPTVIAIDRDARTLRLYEHLKLERRYKIAVGKAGTESSAGRYEVVEKIVDPPWHAPNKEWAGELAGKTIPPGDPRNPLAARWMGYHAGEGIHGTKDVASLGSAASHGCIRMSIPDVKELYAKVPKGTPLFLQ